MAHKEDKRTNNNISGGVSRATPNTINGAWAENRGRRGDQLREDNPFENGDLYNWNRREGWDQYFQSNHQGKGPRGYSRPDMRIHDDVCEVLTRNQTLDASNIDVQVESGVVTLSGKVDDRMAKRLAGRIIENLPGVRDIHNVLEFDRS